MAQIRRLEKEIVIKSHADKFFDVWARRPDHVPNMCPEKMLKVELDEGDWCCVGAVKTWNYHDGGRAYIKTEVQEIDEDNRSVSYNLIDGHIMKNFYKSFKAKIQAIPKGENTCSVKWTYEYEKMNENAPEPNEYIDFLLSCAEDIGARCSA